MKRPIMGIGSLALVCTGAAWARPGGGSSYRSSSYRSSSSSSNRSSSSSYRSSGSSYRSSGSSYRSSSGGSYSGGGGDSSNGAFSFFLLVVIMVLVLLALINSVPKDNFITQEGDSRSAPPGSDLGSRIQLGCLLSILGLLALPFLLKWLAPFIPLAVVGGLIWMVWRSQNSGATTRVSSEMRVANNNLSELFRADPNFSLPIFREFAVLLYSQAMLERLSRFPTAGPYLADVPANNLANRSRARAVRDVVVGSCRLQVAHVVSGCLILRVAFESNYLEEDANGRVQAFVANEDWVFTRKMGKLTRRPEGVRKLGCPSCGYAGEFSSSGPVPNVKTPIARGRSTGS